jgi:hypothetical protein
LNTIKNSVSELGAANQALWPQSLRRLEASLVVANRNSREKREAVSAKPVGLAAINPFL